MSIHSHRTKDQTKTFITKQTRALDLKASIQFNGAPNSVLRRRMTWQRLGIAVASARDPRQMLN